jgi:hypothetical protein
MTDMLRFVILPATLILVVTWWLVLNHSRTALLPFLIVMTAVLLALGLFGVSPLVFFVSFSGYLWFAVVALSAATVVRGVREGILQSR